MRFFFIEPMEWQFKTPVKMNFTLVIRCFHCDSHDLNNHLKIAFISNMLPILY